MILRLGGGTELLVSLTPGPLKYSGPEELTQYYVKKYLIGEISLENSKGLSISITFGRRLLGTILTVYLPTVLLNVIGHATNFFKPFFFEAVVTVVVCSSDISPRRSRPFGNSSRRCCRRNPFQIRQFR